MVRIHRQQRQRVTTHRLIYHPTLYKRQCVHIHVTLSLLDCINQTFLHVLVNQLLVVVVLLHLADGRVLLMTVALHPGFP